MVLHSTRVGLLACTALLTVCVVPGFAAAHRATDRSLTVLYDQTSNPGGNGTFSQNFSDDPAQSSAAADDFVVPDGQTWIVKEIDVPGLYFNGSGPADSENVTFFKDKNHKVGKTVAELDNLHGTDVGFGSFDITLGDKGVKLKSGHYWVSVVANFSFSPGGEWGWENQTAGTIEGDPAMWEQPGGTTCPTWCVEGGGDQMFTLKGKAK